MESVALSNSDSPREFIEPSLAGPLTVGQLAEKPHRFAKKLVNSTYYRLRVGDYRIIPDIQGSFLRILILKVGPRDSLSDR